MERHQKREGDGYHSYHCADTTRSTRENPVIHPTCTDTRRKRRLTSLKKIVIIRQISTLVKYFQNFFQKTRYLLPSRCNLQVEPQYCRWGATQTDERDTDQERVADYLTDMLIWAALHDEAEHAAPPTMGSRLCRLLNGEPAPATEENMMEDEP